MLGTRSRIAGLAALFTYLFFFEYLPPFSRLHVPYDLHTYHYSLTDYVIRQLKSGNFPQWDPTIYCGIGLGSNIQAQLFYPPAWLLFVANLRRDHLSFASLEIFLFLHIALAFTLCWLWLRARGLHPLASTFGAGAFAFGGYACLQLQHLGLIAGYAWFPAGFLGIDEAVRGNTWRPLWKTAVASALCLLAGYPPIWFALAVALLIYSIASSLKIAVATGAAIAFSLLLCAVQVLPAAESTRFMVHQYRYGPGVRDPWYYLSLVVPNYFNFGLNVPIFTNPGQDYLYLGAPAMAGLALLFRRRTFRNVAGVLAVLIVTAIFLTNPFGIVAWSIGWSSTLVEICRDWYFLAPVFFALAALAAYGIDDFLKRPARPASPWVSIIVLAFVTGFAAWELWTWSGGGRFPDGPRAIFAPAFSLIAFGSALYVLRGHKGVWRAVFIAAVVLSSAIDYKVFGTDKRFNSERGRGEAQFTPSRFPEVEPEAVAQLKSHAEWRVLSEGGPLPLELRETGLITPQGFDPFVTSQFQELLAGKAVFSTDRLFDVNPERKDVLQLLGVRFIITHEGDPVYPRLHADADFRELGRGLTYYRVFEYLNAVAPFGWENETKLASWQPERRVFDVSSEQGGRFVFKEQLLPGWEAFVDGQPSPVERWNIAFQSVNIPPGAHRVEFRYQSKALIEGAWISGVALIAMIAGLFNRRERLSPT